MLKTACVATHVPLFSMASDGRLLKLPMAKGFSMWVSYGANMDTEQLILQAREGCPTAVGKLLEAYRPMFLQIANNELAPALKAKVGASDIVQETCLDAAQCIGQFRGTSPQQLSKWLMEILRNNLSHARRNYDTSKRDLRRETQRASDSSLWKSSRSKAVRSARVMSPLSAILHVEATVHLERALTSLSDLDQKVIVMRNRDRMPFAEIGRRIDRKSDAARKIWSRAIETLQIHLQKTDGPVNE